MLEAIGFAVGGRPGARLAAALGLDAAAATTIIAALRVADEPACRNPRRGLFHLVHNLVDALEQACGRHHRALHTPACGEPAAGTTSDVGESAPAPRRRRYSGLPRNRPGPTAAERRSAARRARRLARYEQIVALRAAGQSKLGIARLTGIDRRTWLAGGHFPERAPSSGRPTCVDPFAEFLAARVAAGEANAAHLTRELIARGYRGSYQAVRRAARGRLLPR